MKKSSFLGFSRRLFAFAAIAATLVPAAMCQLNHFSDGPTAGTYQGPSSSQPAYVVPTSAGWETLALITVGDASQTDSYTMIGIPDGLGALAGKEQGGGYVSDSGYITLFMNHELEPDQGAVRAHGVTGAFVSQWTIQLNSLLAKRGRDLIEKLYLWDSGTSQYYLANGTPAARINRFCSADLPKAGAFYNAASGKGYNGRIFTNGEETSTGRAFAHVVAGAEKGNSYQLPYMGSYAFENAVAHPDAGDKTIMIGLDDSTPGQVYVYVGNKQTAGNPVEKAGLTGGALYAIGVTDGGANYGNSAVARENNGPIAASDYVGAFTLVDVSDVALASSADLNTASINRGATNFARPEDGAWDTQNPNVFYFNVTGANIDGQGQSARLYKLTFNSIANPTGGTIELIVDRADLLPASPTFAQFDNLTVTGDGTVIVQEDPGGKDYLAQVWSVNPNTKVATSILMADPNRFGPPTTPPFNVDEESSAVIEITDLVKSANWYEEGRRYFAATLQAHYDEPSPLIEGGQLFLFASPKPE